MIAISITLEQMMLVTSTWLLSLARKAISMTISITENIETVINSNYIQKKLHYQV